VIQERASGAGRRLAAPGVQIATSGRHMPVGEVGSGEMRTFSEANMQIKVTPKERTF
jgi:hypothetical protein